MERNGITMKYIKRFLKHYLYNTKLVHKFFYLLALLLIIEIIVSNFYIKNNAAQLLTNEIHTTSKQFIQQYVDNIGYKLTKFNTLLNSFSSNERIKQSFTTPREEDHEMIHREIQQILNNQFPYGIYDLTFYPLANYPTENSSFIKSLDTATGNWITELNNGNFNHYFKHIEGTYNTELLSILKPIYSVDGSKVVCIIKLSLFPEKVFKSIKDTEGERSHQLFIIDNNINFIYGETLQGIDQFLQYLKRNYKKIYSSTFVEDFTDKDAEGIYLTSTNSAFGFRAVYYFSYAESFDSLRTLNRTITIGILILLFLTFTAVSILSLSVNKRFKIVLSKIKTVKEGNLKIPKSSLGCDEIGIFDTSFTQMVHRVDELIERNYISEMKKKDAEFMALQAQINPHFLFNSLEIINALIEIEQYDAACEVNARLSSLLRYSINHNSSGIVTLEEEINYMKDYIYIQKMRFQNKYSFHLDIEEDCLNYHIIKLVFQPLIENSLKHGLSGIQTGGNIWFSIKKDRNNLKIIVSDDGNGMNTEDYNALINMLNQDNIHDFTEKNESIGILNIHNRLRLKFGKHYKITLTTAPQEGMCTEITIPIL